MTDSLVVAICLAIAVVLVFHMLPAAGKYAALYGLHGLRDRLYMAARAYPGARNSALYRDAEFLLTSTIHVVRDRGYSDSFRLMVGIMSDLGEADKRRISIYDKERGTVFASVQGQNTLEEILSAALDMRLFVMLHGMTGHPLVAFAVLAGLVVVIPVVIGRELLQSMSPENQSQSTRLAAAVADIDKVTLAEAIAHLTATLVETLGEELQRVGRHVVILRLRGGQGHRSSVTPINPPWSTATQVIADGYEQLGCLGRARLRWTARHAGAGLIVTAHAPAGLPTLLHTAPDLETVQAMVHTLLGDQLSVIRDQDVAASFASHCGNVREVLFDLYDLYERRHTG